MAISKATPPIWTISVYSKSFCIILNLFTDSNRRPILLLNYLFYLNWSFSLAEGDIFVKLGPTEVVARFLCILYPAVPLLELNPVSLLLLPSMILLHDIMSQEEAETNNC